MRRLPILMPGSKRGARFALAVRAVAGDAAYARVHDRLWALRRPFNSASFEQIAADEGLDVQAIADAMDDPAISARIDFNREAATALEILGTPAFMTPSTISVGERDSDALATLWLNR